MARIRAVAPLVVPRLGAVFGSATARIKQWADGEEPDRPKLDRILNALSEASIHRHDLPHVVTARRFRAWMFARSTCCATQRWRAFRGAIELARGVRGDGVAGRARAPRHAQSSWVVAEPRTFADEA